MKIKGLISKKWINRAHINFKNSKNDNSKYISRNLSGAVAGSVGSIQYQLVPCSFLYLLHWPLPM